MEEATHDTSSRKWKSSGLIDTYFAQCGKCYKWRSIESQEAYEKIRSEALNKSFECNNCGEPGDADVEGDSTRVWCEDHLHGLPQTPQGFKRILVLRESCHRADVYYLTPQGKRLRSCREVAGFIQDNEGFADTQIEDISFAAPKVMNKKKDVAAPTNRPALVLKRCETLSKKKTNKKSSKSSLVINSDYGEGKVMPESLQNERQATDKEDEPLGDVELSHIQKGSETLSKKKRNKKRSKIAAAINSDGEGKIMPESLQNERSTTKEDEPLGDVELSHILKGSGTLSKKKRNKKRSKIAVAINSDERPATDKNIENEACTKKSLKSDISSSNEVIIEELEKAKSDGKVAANGKKVSILYTGKLKDTGKLFDSNMGETPFRFRLGRGKVIEGLSIGIEGMRVGDKRRITIPPSLGYSEEGFKDVVPNNAWLVYEVEAVKVR